MSYGDYNFSLAANAGLDIPVTGSEIFVRSATGLLRVTLSTGEILELSQNQGLELKGKQFQNINIKDLSGAPNAGVLFLGDATFRDQTFTGTVTILNFPANQGAFTQAKPAVTNASGNLLAAKANRRFVLIQNKDAAANIFLNFTGVAATVANGVQIEPGGSMKIEGYQATAAITVIADQLTADVVVVEG